MNFYWSLDRILSESFDDNKQTSCCYLVFLMLSYVFQCFSLVVFYCSLVCLCFSVVVRCFSLVVFVCIFSVFFSFPLFVFNCLLCFCNVFVYL